MQIKKKTYTKQEIFRFEYHKKNKSHQLSFYYQNDELYFMDPKNLKPESCGVYFIKKYDKYENDKRILLCNECY